MSLLNDMIKEELEGAVIVEHGGIEATLIGVPSGVIVDLYKEHGKDPKQEDEFSTAMFDAMILHSIKLSALPDDDTWLQELELSVKLGISKLPEWIGESGDLSALNVVEKKYLYKRYCYATGAMIQQIGLMTEGIEEAVSEAIKEAAKKAN